MLEQKISLVYGSGKIGLMGEIAKTVHEGGGKVTGVTPGFIKSKSYTARSIISVDWYTIGLQQLFDDEHGDVSFILSMLLP